MYFVINSKKRNSKTFTLTRRPKKKSKFGKCEYEIYANGSKKDAVVLHNQFLKEKSNARRRRPPVIEPLRQELQGGMFDSPSEEKSLNQEIAFKQLTMDKVNNNYKSDDCVINLYNNKISEENLLNWQALKTNDNDILNPIKSTQVIIENPNSNVHVEMNNQLINENEIKDNYNASPYRNNISKEDNAFFFNTKQPDQLTNHVKESSIKRGLVKISTNHKSGRENEEVRLANLLTNHENDRQGEPGLEVSFAGCGFLSVYYVGVTECLRQHVKINNIKKIYGVSAGSVAAICFLCDLPLGM